MAKKHLSIDNDVVKSQAHCRSTGQSSRQQALCTRVKEGFLASSSPFLLRPALRSSPSSPLSGLGSSRRRERDAGPRGSKPASSRRGRSSAAAARVLLYQVRTSHLPTFAAASEVISVRVVGVGGSRSRARDRIILVRESWLRLVSTSVGVGMGFGCLIWGFRCWEFDGYGFLLLVLLNSITRS